MVEFVNKRERLKKAYNKRMAELRRRHWDEETALENGIRHVSHCTGIHLNCPCIASQPVALSLMETGPIQISKCLDKETRKVVSLEKEFILAKRVTKAEANLSYSHQLHKMLRLLEKKVGMVDRRISGLPDLNKNNNLVPVEQIWSSSKDVSGPTQNVQLFDIGIINDTHRCLNGQFMMTREAAPSPTVYTMSAFVAQPPHENPSKLPANCKSVLKSDQSVVIYTMSAFVAQPPHENPSKLPANCKADEFIKVQDKDMEEFVNKRENGGAEAQALG
ncbi:hypothetical protein PHJA_000162200 [Phtheirospermum japonicum]|uniref:Uncharacterized protein n=1 Tax=Phtheirospermum japonicum TaxID=374723 RepID=A0A830B596_9LAMI|nr:hypothetical protein PHJA_000162200 [Phtheirospermum japonicum]